MRRDGVIFFDVDDTLLARRRGRAGSDQTYAESAAARLVASLLDAEVTVCLITGHGWKQLEKRFVLPLIEDCARRFPERAGMLAGNFYVYANRGATKLVRAGDRFRESAAHAEKYSLDKRDRGALEKILVNLKDELTRDFERRPDWYLQNFPEFPFAELPAEIFARENAVLGLRPIPSNYYASETVESPRARLFARGLDALAVSDLAAKYRLDKSGRSTLEITRRNVSKRIAFADLLGAIAEGKGVPVETVEAASVYIGDEFEREGNDAVIAREFPRCLCLSVGDETRSERLAENVVSIRNLAPEDGVSATAAVVSRIIKFLT